MAKESLKYTPGWRDRKNEKLSARTGSKYVGILKILLPILAAIGLIVIMVWPKIRSLIYVDDPATRKIHSIIKSQPKIKNTAINPEFVSVDKKGRPYTLRAKQYVSPNNDFEIMDLSNPSGEFKLDDNDTVKFTANVGQYTKSKDLLKLTGSVHMSTKKGYDLYTAVADVDLKANVGDSNVSTYGTGPIGENILAEGFQITDKGDKVTFKGKTKITIPPEGK